MGPNSGLGNVAERLQLNVHWQFRNRMTFRRKYIANSSSLGCWPAAGVESAIRNNRTVINIFNLLSAELTERVADWSARDLHQAIKRVVHFQNKKDRAGNG